jgi:uncharacterized membrane protein YidH (DUF202 family)
MRSPGDADGLQGGTARQRTALAWTRTAITFAAVGGAMLRTSLAAGLVVLAMSVLIWGLRRLLPDAASDRARPVPLLLLALTVAAVSVVALLVAFT